MYLSVCLYCCVRCCHLRTYVCMHICTVAAVCVVLLSTCWWYVYVGFFNDNKNTFIRDSFDIYKHVSSRYTSKRIHAIIVDEKNPSEHAKRLIKIKELSDKIAEAGRIRTINRMSNNDEVTRQMIPFPINYTGPIGRAMARSISNRMKNKYTTDGIATDEKCLATMRSGLNELCKEVNIPTGDASSNYQFQYSFPQLGFTYGDILVANSCSGIKPHAEYSNLSGAWFQCWSEVELQKEYSYLLAWRDELYNRHRKVDGAATPNPQRARL